VWFCKETASEHANNLFYLWEEVPHAVICSILG
jgi:hypothetical protein